MSIASVSVGTSATLIIAQNFERVGLIIDNDGGATVFLGDGSGVTTSTGIQLANDATRELFPPTNAGSFYYKGAIYGIVASGTNTVRVWEMLTTR